MRSRFYISDEIRFLIQKYNLEEYELVKNRIIVQKKYPTITTWNNVVVDGIEEFELCEKEDLPYRINTINASSKNHLYSWICSKQLERTDLNSSMYRFLIGFQAMVEKEIEGNRSGMFLGENATAIKKLAALYGYNTQRISWYKQFATNMVKIRETNPAIAEYILSEKLIASWNNVEYLSKRSSQELENLKEHMQKIEKEKPYKFNDIQKEIDSEYKPRRTKKRINAEEDLEIKKMPEYDPDSEIKSLTLTISSWINTIDRLNKKGYGTATKIAKTELAETLKQLIDVAYATRRQLGTK